MVEIILEPYAACQHWSLSGKSPAWSSFFEEYLLSLARACQAAGSPVIGHIKALALFPAKGFFRASVVDTSLPVTLEGSFPPNLTSLTLTLNLIVYGLSRETLQHITLATSLRMAENYQGKFINQPECQTHPPHP